MSQTPRLAIAISLVVFVGCSSAKDEHRRQGDPGESSARSDSTSKESEASRASDHAPEIRDSSRSTETFSADSEPESKDPRLLDPPETEPQNLEPIEPATVGPGSESEPQNSIRYPTATMPSSPPAAEPPMPDEAPAADRVVRVFYATDRQPHLPVGSGKVEWSLYVPAFIGAVITVLLVVLTFKLNRKVIVAVLAMLSFAGTASLGQQLLVRMQQVERAANHLDRTYGENRHEQRGNPVLELGVCEVSIPPDHRVGQVETPSILRLEFRENPTKHVILERTTLLETDAFYASLSQSVTKSAKQQAFVFIHGYNVGFDSAVKRTAQIAFDLNFDGAAICYTWPSNAGLADYKRDEASIGWTVTQLDRFLIDLTNRSGARTIHIVAHSMGNRALLQAIERMSLRGDVPKFGQVVLAAPDTDSGEFRTRFAPALVAASKRVTLYASSNDQALLASTRIHGYNRAGLSGENLVITSGIETIDVSPVDTSLIGHSYYGDNPLLIRDLAAVVGLDLPAENRQWLKRSVLETDQFYWTFRRSLEGDGG